MDLTQHIERLLANDFFYFQIEEASHYANTTVKNIRRGLGNINGFLVFGELYRPNQVLREPRRVLRGLDWLA